MSTRVSPQRDSRDTVTPYGRFSLLRVTGGAPTFPLLILFALNAVDELDRSAFAVLTPTIRDHFGLENEGILGVISLVTIAGLGAQWIVGYYADRMSRVTLAVGGAAVWGLFTLGTGIAPTIALLVLARSLTQVGTTVVGPTHNSLLADYYPPEARVRVYGFHRTANSVGQIVGPLAGGALAFLFGWRAPFLVLWIPTAIIVGIALAKLRDPVRGEHERRSMGASEETIGTEESAPSLGEAWRICYQVKTLRRIWYSLPFLATALVGFASIASIFYEEAFGLDDFQRGVALAIAEPFQLVGLLIGIPIANRMGARNPGLVLRFLAIAGVVVGVAIVLFAFAPNVVVAVAMNSLVSASIAVLVPGIYAVLSLAIPPRARGLGFSIGSLYVIPGLVVLPIVGGLADDIGVRGALLVLVPIFMIGAFVIASAGAFVAADIHKVRTSTTAQAEVTAARRRGEVKLLLVKDLDVSYDTVQVLFGVNFEVDEGEIVALLGTNGAGKSTLLKAISGLVEAGAGAVVFDGRDATYATPQEVAARGVIQVPGGKGVFPGLTVAENLRIAGWLYQRDSEYLRTATEEVLGFFPVLRERWDQPAGNLSGGEQQMLTLAQAFLAKPRLLMIDELSLGLAPIIVEQLLEIVRAIRDRGTTIILVEQSVNVALTLAETAYFMEKGEIRFHGPTAELLERPDVLRSVFLEGAGAAGMGGSATSAKTPARTRRPGELERAGARAGVAADGDARLEVMSLGLSFGGVRAIDDISLTLRPGEILGVIGPNGAGKTTMFDLVSGYLRPDRGRIVLNGVDVTADPPHIRARHGLGRSFQDARLFPGLTVADTIALSLARQVEVRDPVLAVLNMPAVADSEVRIHERVDELIELMGLGAFAEKYVRELSTGSRRIVDLACLLAHDPDVLLFDEPSSGIAQRETEALGPLLLRIREETGASLLVIEHDMPLISSVSDRMLALDLGRVIAEGTPEEVVNDPTVVASYLGTTEEVIARSGDLSGTGATATLVAGPKTRKRASKRAPAKKAPAKKAVGKKATSKKAAARKAGGTKTAGQKAGTPAKKLPGKKAQARKSTVGKRSTS